MAKRKPTKEENLLLPLNLPDNLEESSEKHLRSYIPSPFIAAALPSRDIKKPVFIRKYNNVTMKLTSGSKVPFGKYGRLLLTILTTHAVLCKNTNPHEPVVINYKSLNQLLKELQLPSSRSNDIKEQLDSILKQIGENDEIIISDDGSSDNTIEVIKSLRVFSAFDS